MLTASLAAYTLVAVLGFLIALDLLRGFPIDRKIVLIHAGIAVFGALLLIGAALGGDSRVYANIGLVAIIAPLGFLAATKRYKTGVVPKNLILAHAGLAVVFYLLLVSVVAGVKVIG